MARLSLDPSVELRVLSRAKTERDHHEDFGCGLTGIASRAVRDAARPLVREIRALGSAKALAAAPRLVRELESGRAWSALCEGAKKIGGRRRLRDEIVRPPVEPPRVLHVRRGSEGLDIEVPPDEWEVVSALFQTLRFQGATRGDLEALARDSRAVAELVHELSAARALIRHRPPLDLPPGTSVLFAGHNMVLMRSGGRSILIDPWFRPVDPRDAAAGYTPMSPAELGRVDAIAITHCHGDHFHAGSLLQFGYDVPIYVPDVRRETLLASDLHTRLRALGFRKVERLAWGDTRRIGGLSLRALPFHGEQPTQGEPLYEGLWNEGNTYCVRTPSVSCAFLADTGRDARGSMNAVAAREVKARGPVDIVFGGIRGFKLAPLFFPFTTLDAFFANVPLDAMAESQPLMTDAEAAVDVAQAFRARWFVPYADGGSPWYWREGMGPAYPGYPIGSAVAHDKDGLGEDPDSDPFPEKFAEARAKREWGPEPLMLRPGDAFRMVRDRLERHRYEGHAWPFED